MRTQEDDKPVMVIVEELAIPVEVTLLDNMAEECKELVEELVVEPQDTFSQVVEGDDMQTAECETEHEVIFLAVNNEVPGLETTNYEPLAPGPQEEDNLADAQKAEVAAFAGLEAPVETHENPQ